MSFDEFVSFGTPRHSLILKLKCSNLNIQNSVLAQNRYWTRSPTPCRRLWCWCPRIFGRRHLPSKRAWKMFTLYWRCWCRFYEEKQFVVNFGTWMMNQNALWQLKSPQTKTRKTKTACWQNGGREKSGTKKWRSRTSGWVSILWLRHRNNGPHYSTERNGTNNFFAGENITACTSYTTGMTQLTSAFFRSSDS